MDIEHTALWHVCNAREGDAYCMHTFPTPWSGAPAHPLTRARSFEVLKGQSLMETVHITTVLL